MNRNMFYTYRNRNMFYNYDNHIDRKVYPAPELHEDTTRILESENNAWIIGDIKGNEIGVQVKHGAEFTLYFTLDGEVENSSIFELVSESTIVFEIIDYLHNVIITKLPDTVDYDLDTDTLAITVNADEAKQLKAESYRIRLRLTWPGGEYELFSENSCWLIVR